MATVTAAEFRRHLGRCRERAQHESMVVNRYCRESLVLLSAEEYRRLKRLDREPFYPREPAEAGLSALRWPSAPDDAEMDWLAGLVGGGQSRGCITGAEHDRVL